MQDWLVCVGVPPQRRRAKRFGVNPRIRHMHPTQPFVKLLGEAARPTQVEIVVVQRQRCLDLFDTQPAGKLVITTDLRVPFRLAQGAVYMQ
ncbi:hypothetical protein D3C72_1727210 [compost metagenome]